MFRFRGWRGAAIVTALAVIAVAVSAGCGGEDTTEATDDLCTSLTDFRTSVASLGALTADSTIEQWDDARNAVSSAWDDVQEQAGDVAEARFDEVETAYDDLDSAIEDVPDDATVEQAVQQVVPQIAAVDASWEAYYSELGCA
jgi:hypothetical protein